MKYFIFRNSTIENLFADYDVSFSGYEDISIIPDDANVYIWFYIFPYKFQDKSITSEVSLYYNNIELVLDQIPENKSFIIFTLCDLINFQIIKSDYYGYKAITEYNLRIIQLSEQRKNVKIINFNDFLSGIPIENLIDWKFYFLSKMQINPKLGIQFKTWFQNQLDSISLKRKKCIIVDLDNTLWGGILGEDGITGISIGDDYPGNAFGFFQKSLLELSNSGIILAIASKNNAADVMELWEKNPNMILRKEHFVTYRINWNNKAENITEIVNEMNIGFDSVVFIDDNPTERELIRQYHPLITTPDFPSQPYLIPVFVKKLFDEYFRVYSITDEDRTKTTNYIASSARDSFQKKFQDFSHYLKSLEIEIELQPANSFNISRIAQMTQKTNQFNLTTKRYVDTDIMDFIQKGHLVYCIRVKDRFGDNGITGLIIVLLDERNRSASIDTFLLSCRILGKGIEEAFAFTVFNKLKSSEYKLLKASYIPTAKNSQVRGFYDKLGFEHINEESEKNGSKFYIMDLAEKGFNIKEFYKLTETNNERENKDYSRSDP